eukprot:Sro539_g162820.1 n/a (295) ;mRNA; r:23258-24142
MPQLDYLKSRLDLTPPIHWMISVCYHTGKVHWIEWSMFCDRLDEALKPLRPLACSYPDDSNHKKRRRSFAFRRKSMKSKVLKNLQQVCDKQAKQMAPIIQDFILYCPCDSRGKTVNVTHWHIQVVLPPQGAAVVTSSSSSFDLLDTVPATISIPITPASSPMSSRETLPPPPQSFPLDRDSRPRCSFSRRHNHSNSYNNIHNSNINHAGLQRQASNASSSTIATTTSAMQNSHRTNPFLDDPNDTVAMSRDALMELDRRMDWEEWNQVPTIPPDVSMDQMPIPMPPPAPYVKEV